MAKKQAKDDADVFIVETAIEESKHHKTAVIVEDIDLRVSFIERTQSHEKEKFFKKVGKRNLKTLSNILFQKF
ncbi:hypothetical protein TNCV_809831 [Trichonephila clavipes]|uniref:Uncharacterized protein n=1 Tax=Trichonephila clavipes TaxID=2585209 RepID=A0A8X6SC48_TRICX|nr:hypothetical protein TNCV_809831 [Trichonephila clavipes]